MEWKFEDKDKFAAEKKRILTKADMSKKGQVDQEIKDIVDAINSKEDYCTTSSCAGRIMFIERRSHRKIDSKWLYLSHQPVNIEDIKINDLSSKHDVWLMQESCIVHIMCRTIEAAEKFLEICRRVGFKRSGVLSVHNKIGIETIGNEKIEALISKNGKMLVSEEYIKISLDEANKRMLKNREKMKMFLNELKQL